MQTATAWNQQVGNHTDTAYTAFIERVQQRFLKNTEGGTLPVFTTNAVGIWNAYLTGFEPSERQHHNCRACQQFIERVGTLVVIAIDGTTRSAMWDAEDDDGGQHAAALNLMRASAEHAPITGLFLSSEPHFGHPQTGNWRHLWLPNVRQHKHPILSASQAAAGKLQDFQTVGRAVGEYSRAVVDQALTLLKSDALFRSEKVLGGAQWLSDLHAALEGARGPRRNNILWRFVATAPDGFCHPKTSMIGTLLDDLSSGVAFADASRKFAAKMDPLHYQRPQAAPSAGNIAQAEKLVEKLGIAPSLERRFARLEEINALWKPEQPAPAAAAGGVFSHLKPKEDTHVGDLHVHVKAITWEKFARDVLPTAKSMQVSVPHRGDFTAIVTATNEDAPPILQWDSVERRNPFSLYLYHHGSLAMQWGFLGGSWARVTAVTLRPEMWFNSGFNHFGVGAIFILEGAKDSRTGNGLGLFPETLRSELREVRATIEAHSKTGELTGREEASANGLMIGKNSGADSSGELLVRVDLGAGVRADYRIDRWE